MFFLHVFRVRHLRGSKRVLRRRSTTRSQSRWFLPSGSYRCDSSATWHRTAHVPRGRLYQVDVMPRRSSHYPSGNDHGRRRFFHPQGRRSVRRENRLRIQQRVHGCSRYRPSGHQTSHHRAIRTIHRIHPIQRNHRRRSRRRSRSRPNYLFLVFTYPISRLHVVRVIILRGQGHHLNQLLFGHVMASFLSRVIVPRFRVLLSCRVQARGGRRTSSRPRASLSSGLRLTVRTFLILPRRLSVIINGSRHPWPGNHRRRRSRVSVNRLHAGRNQRRGHGSGSSASRHQHPFLARLPFRTRIARHLTSLRRLRLIGSATSSDHQSRRKRSRYRDEAR